MIRLKHTKRLEPYSRQISIHGNLFELDGSTELDGSIELSGSIELDGSIELNGSIEFYGSTDPDEHFWIEKYDIFFENNHKKSYE